MKNKLTTLTVAVPYKRAGNVIHQKDVSFDLFQEDDKYSLVPLLSPYELEVANLPSSLDFVMQDGKPVSLRGKRDGNLHVIQDAARQLTEQNILY